jgi:hypothetical protein
VALTKGHLALDRRGAAWQLFSVLPSYVQTLVKAVPTEICLDPVRERLGAVSDGSWRPLGVDTDEHVAEYDALHDGLPEWMSAPHWTWVRGTITIHRTYADRSGRVAMLNSALVEEMCQTLRIPMPTLRSSRTDAAVGKRHLDLAMQILAQHQQPLQIVDYLLAHAVDVKADDLEALLTRSKSAWTVGVRSGRPGLTRRVPLGVQVAADAVMARAGRAGVRLAKAWEELYGLDPNPSEAYRLAILAVETRPHRYGPHAVARST